MHDNNQYLEEEEARNHEPEEEQESDKNEETDYSSLDRHELYQKIRELGEEEDLFFVKNSFEKAVSAYRSIMDEEFRNGLEKYKSEGGLEEDYVGVPNDLDEKVTEADKAFHKKLSDLRRQREKDQQENLKTRLGLIEELKALTDEAGDMSLRFQTWHDIQHRWRSAGTVPSANRSEVYNNYRHYNNLFFSQVQLSREFRELDLKKNIELRKELIREAQGLADGSEVGKALKEYQRLQQRWRDTGPVPVEVKDELWTQFREAGDRIFEKRKIALEQREKQKEENLVKKKALLDDLRKIAQVEEGGEGFKTLKSRLNTSEELFAKWKTIGYVPESDNGQTWKEFRNLRSQLFRERDAYFAKRRDEFQENLKVKTALCEKAEALKDSNDFPQVSRQLKRLQEEWKKSGPVSKKHSDKIWKRFRAACDEFFTRRDSVRLEKEKELVSNVGARKDFLDKMPATPEGDDPREMIASIERLKSQWRSIGNVPMDDKKNLESDFNKKISALYEKVKSASADDPALFQKLQFEQVLNSEGGEQKLIREKTQLKDKIRKLEAEIIQYENNMGFFNTSGSNPLIDELKQKIESKKQEVTQLKSKLKMIPV